MSRGVVLVGALLLATAFAPRGWCQTPPGLPSSGASDATEVSAAWAAAKAKVLEGEWVGARLLCRKETDNAVRCGKPVDFSVTFHGDGTGSSTDEHFPHSFAYRWKSKSEMVLVPRPAGDELALFQLEIAEGFLSFQTYIYLAGQDANGQNYIHYIFDVQRLR